MSDRAQEPPGYSDGLRYVFVLNTTAEDIPPYAAMEVCGYDADVAAMEVRKPTRASACDVLFNGPQPIASQEDDDPADRAMGMGTPGPLCPAAWYDDGSLDVRAGGEETLVLPGETLGTVPGEWFLARGQSGYVVVSAFGATGDKMALVMPATSRPVAFVEVIGESAPLTDGTPSYYDAARVVYLDVLTGTWTLPDEQEDVWYVDSALATVAPDPANATDTVDPLYVVPAVLAGTAFDRPVFVGLAGRILGPTDDVTVVTKVCPVLDVYGAATVGTKYEAQVIRIPTSWLIGDPFCHTNLSNCCPPSWYCVSGVCTEYAYGDTIPVGACGPWLSEAICDLSNMDRWYCVAGVCTQVLACDCPPAGAVGPYADEAACEAGGCEDTSTTTAGCCVPPIRQTLWATVAGIGSYLCVFNGIDTWATGTVNAPSCDEDFIFNLKCASLGGGLYEWQATGNGTTGTIVSESCDPFEIVTTIQLFQTDPTGLCYGTTQTITITD